MITGRPDVDVANKKREKSNATERCSRTDRLLPRCAEIDWVDDDGGDADGGDGGQKMSSTHGSVALVSMDFAVALVVLLATWARRLRLFHRSHFVLHCC